MKRSNRWVVGFAVMGASMLAVQAAQARFIVTLVSPDDPGGAAANTVTVLDGGGNDLATPVNQIEYSGSVGSSFPITLQISLTNSPGSPSGATLQVSDIVATNSSGTAKHLLIDVTSTDYTTPSGNGLTLLSLFSGNNTPALGDVNFQSAADPDNHEYGNDIYPTAVTPPSFFDVNAVHTALQDQPGAALSFNSPTQTATFNALSAYSLTSFTTFLIPAGSSYNVSGTTSVNPVTGGTPEPASLALLGLGGVALLRRRR